MSVRTAGCVALRDTPRQPAQHPKRLKSISSTAERTSNLALQKLLL